MCRCSHGGQWFLRLQAFAEQKSAHISVEVLTERLSLLVQKNLADWVLLLSVAVFGLMTMALLIIGIGVSVLQRFMALSGAGEYVSDLIIGQSTAMTQAVRWWSILLSTLSSRCRHAPPMRRK